MKDIYTRVTTYTKQSVFTVNPELTEAQQAAQKIIVKNIRDAGKLLQEAKELADRHDFPFEVAVMTADSYQETNWAGSDDCYGELL